MNDTVRDKPSEAMVEAAAKAMRDAWLDSGEGTLHRLFDLLDCSGENKSHIFTRQLAEAALTAAKNAQKSERVEALEKAAKVAERVSGFGLSDKFMMRDNIAKAIRALIEGDET